MSTPDQEKVPELERFITLLLRRQVRLAAWEVWLAGTISVHRPLRYLGTAEGFGIFQREAYQVCLVERLSLHGDAKCRLRRGEVGDSRMLFSTKSRFAYPTLSSLVSQKGPWVMLLVEEALALFTSAIVWRSQVAGDDDDLRRLLFWIDSSDVVAARTRNLPASAIQ